jgi:hypothetical protein
VAAGAPPRQPARPRRGSWACSPSRSWRGGDDNNLPDVFVHDRDADQDGVFDEPGAIATVRASGGTPFGSGQGVALSGDGRFVAFDSWANGLVPDDTDNQPDVFVRDLKDGVTKRVSTGTVGPGMGGPGVELAARSADGRLVAFVGDLGSTTSPANGEHLRQVYLHDTQTGATAMASVSLSPILIAGNGPVERSGGIALSGDGRFIVFASDATNLVPGDTNMDTDVFLAPTGR